jgi:hypothetical protein
LLPDIVPDYSKIAAAPNKIIGPGTELSTRKNRWQSREITGKTVKIMCRNAALAGIIMGFLAFAALPARAETYNENAQYNIRQGENLDPAAQVPTTGIPPTRTTYGYIVLPSGEHYPYIGPQEKMIPTHVLQPGEHPENWKAPMPRARPLPGVSGMRRGENPELDAAREAYERRLRAPYPGKPGTTTTVVVPRGALRHHD